MPREVLLVKRTALPPMHSLCPRRQPAPHLTFPPLSSPCRWEGVPACLDTCPQTTFPLQHPFAGLSAYGGRLLADGMNDQGLSAGILWIDDQAASYNYRWNSHAGSRQ